MHSSRLALLFCLLFAVSAVSAQLCSDNDVVVAQKHFDSAVKQVERLRTNAGEEVYVLSMAGLLYYSSNAGQSWTDITNLLSHYYVRNDQGEAGIAKIIPAAGSSRGLMYAVGFSTYYWVLQDATDGASVPQVDEYVFATPLLNVVPNPLDDSQAMLSSPTRDCQAGGDLSRCWTDVYVSSNSGASWALMVADSHQFEWALADDLVFYIANDGSDTVDKRFHIAHAFTANVTYTSDPGALVFTYEHGYLFLAQQSQEEDSAFESELLISGDVGETFRTAQFANELSGTEYDTKAKGYTLADTAFGTAFINVERTDIRYGSLYDGSTVEASFFVSLRFNLVDSNAADFTSIQLQTESGIFVANQYDVTPLTPLQDYTPIVQTMITFDKGGLWQPIPAPANCSDCYLHLYGPTSPDQPQILSDPNAVGLVVASGNVGRYRDVHSDNDKTYFSDSAGYAWTEVLDGPSVVGLADHGSLMLALEHGQETGLMRYSWNQGIDWTGCLLTADAFTVEKILTMGSTTSTTFLIIGTAYNGIRYSGVSVYVEFTSDARPRDCVGMATPDSLDSDYTTWTAAVDDFCLLGKTATYVRRKRESVCYTTDAFEYHNAAAEVACPCTRADYMCDGACWTEATDGTGECVYLCEDMEQNDECIDGEKVVSQGYMKVPGDMCQGGLDLSPTTETCGHILEVAASWQTLLAVIFSLGVVSLTVVAFVLTVVFLAYNRNDEFHDRLQPVVPGWCTDSSVGCCGRSQDIDEDGFYAQLGGDRIVASASDDLLGM